MERVIIHVVTNKAKRVVAMTLTTWGVVTHTHKMYAKISLGFVIVDVAITFLTIDIACSHNQTFTKFPAGP